MRVTKLIKVFSVDNPNAKLDITNIGNHHFFIKDVPIIFEDKIIGVITPTTFQPLDFPDGWYSDAVFFNRASSPNVDDLEFSNYTIEGDYDEETGVMDVMKLLDVTVRAK